MRPGFLIAASLAMVAALHLAASQPAALPIALDQAAVHEGERVTVEGLAVRMKSGTPLRFDVEASGVALPVTALKTDTAEPSATSLQGAWTAVTGSLSRVDGKLTLLADDVRPSAALRATPAWSDIALAPAAWEGVHLQLTGSVAQGQLASAANQMALGRGDWPTFGTVTASGTIRYDASCLCHRFDADSVTAWAAPRP